MDKVRLGFIGCGKHATRDLYPNICHIPGLELVATCDLDIDLARRNARLFGATSHYTDYEEMIENEVLDAVMIVGPPGMHTELGMACLQRGLNIFVEKPIATTVELAKSIAKCADRVGRYGQVGFNMRHAPSCNIAKKIIDDDKFGTPVLFETKYFTQGPWEPWPQWGLEELDWTYMLVQGVHAIDISRYFMGDISSVSAAWCKADNGRQGCAVSMEFASGAVGVMSLAASSPVWETRIEVAGSNSAVVRVDNLMELHHKYDNEPAMHSTWVPATRDFSDRRVGYIGEMEHFTECILNNTRPTPDLWDGYYAAVAADAIIKSIRTRRVVDIRSI